MQHIYLTGKLFCFIAGKIARAACVPKCSSGKSEGLSRRSALAEVAMLTVAAPLLSLASPPAPATALS